MKSQSPRPSNLWALPELTGYFPLSQSYTIRAPTKSKGVLVDARNVIAADVIGSTIFFSNAAKTITRLMVTNFSVQLPDQARFNGLSLYQPSQLVDFLTEKKVPVPDLFTDIPGTNDFRVHFDPQIRELRLCIPRVSEDQRSGALKSVLEHIRVFFKLDIDKRFNEGQIVLVITEIIKNALDHSNKPAVFAMAFRKTDVKLTRFTFCHCEIGDGIVSVVRSFLRKSEDLKLQRLAEKGGVSDVLQWAFQPGNSTKPQGGVNAGLGLTTIHNAAAGIGMQLYLKDAESFIGISGLPAKLTHSEIRETTNFTQNAICFMYFGHLDVADRE